MKKSSALSQQKRRRSVKAEDIFGKPLTKQRQEVLRGLRDKPNAEIDFSTIPLLSEEQIAEFHRPSKQLVAVRLDADLLEWLKGFGPGYSTRIKNILRAVMNHEQARTQRD